MTTALPDPIYALIKDNLLQQHFNGDVRLSAQHAIEKVRKEHKLHVLHAWRADAARRFKAEVPVIGDKLHIRPRTNNHIEE